MRVLFINQFFWPDLAATSGLLTDVARSLAEAGNEVTIICGATPYIQEGTAKSSLLPVRIIRLPALHFARGGVARIVSYLSFLGLASLKGLFAEKPDVVVTMTTPPLVSIVGTLLQKLRGARHFIWEMDLYPDVAVDLGMLKPRSYFTRAFGWVADYQRKKADGIIALGECMKARLIAKGLPREKVHIAENWADGDVFQPGPRIPGGKEINVVYAGNLGLGHDIGTIRSVLEHLAADSRFKFTFVGGGARYEELRSFARTRQLPKVEFLAYRDPSRLLVENLWAADIGLVTQNMNCIGSLVPSKVYSLIAAALPVLFIGPANATPSLMIERYRCGWRFDCGDADGVSDLLIRLADSPKLISQASSRAREVFLNHYDRPEGVGRICRILSETSTQIDKSAAGAALRPQ